MPSYYYILLFISFALINSRNFRNLETVYSVTYLTTENFRCESNVLKFDIKFSDLPDFPSQNYYLTIKYKSDKKKGYLYIFS